MLKKTDNTLDSMLNNTEWSKALYLTERSIKNIQDKPPIPNSDRLVQWLSRLENDNDLIKLRLEQDKISYDLFLNLINDEYTESNPKEYSWYHYLISVFSENNEELSEEEQDFINNNDFPFKTFMIPFLEKAKTSLKVKVNHTIYEKVLDYSVLIEIVFKAVVSQITNFAGKTLIYELNRINDELIGDTPEERYEFFLTYKLGNKKKVLTLLLEYPLLGRLICESIPNIITNIIQSLNRYLMDMDHIEQRFNKTYDRVINIEQTGDAHNSGSVLKLSFLNGEKLLYKPRSLSIDLHFQKLLEWYNAKGINKQFATLSTINRKDYGWQDYIEFKECSTEEEVENFFERQGQYLAVLYLLNATDFHYGNIIAQGEHPFLIDLESLFHNVISNSNKSYTTSSTKKAIDIISNSVIRTSLLPVFAEDVIYDLDVSGLGGGKSRQLVRPMIVNKNTDNMKIVKKTIHSPQGNNLPVFKKEIIDSTDHVQRIKNGFRNTYKITMENLEELLSTDGPIHHFKEDTVRVILRNTPVYSWLLEASTHPKYLKNGLDRVNLFDFLWRLAKDLPDRIETISSECKEMLIGDIPYFSCKINSTNLVGNEKQIIRNVIKEDSLLLVLKKLNNLSLEDCERQIKFIEESLLTKHYISKDLMMESKQKQPLNKVDSEQINKEAFLTEAIKIGSLMKKDAIWGEDKKDVTWLGMGMNSDEKLQYKVMDMGLYNGLLGMSLFYAYLASESKLEEFKDISEACLETALKEQMMTRRQYTSAFSGYTSAIYVLSHLSKLWSNETYLDKAKELVDVIDRNVDKDKNFDLLNGSAGTLIVCLNFYHLTHYDKARGVAVKCGDHLLKHAVSNKFGYGWLLPKNKDMPPLSGLSHGSAGIALALMMLAKETKNQKYLSAGQASLKYENSLYDSELNNWLDLRLFDNDHKAESVVHWCNGAAGIGLGRLKMLEYYQDSQVTTDLDRAVKKTVVSGITGLNYSLCHGDLGNLELLLLSSKFYDDYALRDFAYKKAFEIILKVNKDGKNNWKCGIPGGQQTPNFMVGLSGIGYQLLRFYNNSIPSVLGVLEMPNH
ncbi:type 2 lantipeptide synthetase LanM [Sediminibacillus dalangtanensis]|uniref:Type 2 lantipeptide synthetase LanM n=1 Tax=Sediminibacillus dalangtanensis TaxID=2729421 RepID=A0ABX7VV25_9BACI|nr:type 2 lanthipeptide synthetase LanM family protein [Sediminibacillus dalangtanensis]QTM98471.1 type 2 lantipeptide synthetase LanM [Sediminibacillus dalangtanensis]